MNTAEKRLIICREGNFLRRIVQKGFLELEGFDANKKGLLICHFWQ
jgi:hypothetical protein